MHSDAGVPAVQGRIDERVQGPGLGRPAQPPAGMDDCSIFYDDDGDAQCDMVSIFIISQNLNDTIDGLTYKLNIFKCIF